MPLDHIHVKGAREHNLKNIDVRIPRDKMVVITGLSGSGKSSLAFDTIYAEGQRRYVESLSAYARQFLEMMQKPDVEHIDGLSPAISIEQKTTSRNPRSTVATVTEIYDYMRLLWARVGIPYSPATGLPIEAQQVSQMVDRVMALPEGSRHYLLAPVVRGRKGEYRKELAEWQKAGFTRVRIDGVFYAIEDAPALDKKYKHDIEVVVDRIVVREGIEPRLADSFEQALKLAEGLAYLDPADAPAEPEQQSGMKLDYAPPGRILFSEKFACPVSGLTIAEIEPRLFSFNAPQGACPACDGLGEKLVFDEDLIVPNHNLSIAKGAVVPWAKSQPPSPYYMQVLNSLARAYDFDLHIPWKDLPEEAHSVILHGTSGRAVTLRFIDGKRSYEVKKPFEGVIGNLNRRMAQTESAWMREELSRYQSSLPCEVCHGARLKPEALAVKIAGEDISLSSRRSVADALGWFTSLHEKLTATQNEIAKAILKEINERLGFLHNVGLDYLHLDRTSGTLSGGESQRIRLASQMGSGLSGVLYVLAEPAIGLHQKDNDRLLETLKRLRGLGNTVLVVEHDEEAIRAADHVIDMGPGAGVHGGEVVCAGTLDDLLKCKESITADYLTGRREIPLLPTRRKGSGKYVTVHGATANNLRSVTAAFPLGTFTCVTCDVCHGARYNRETLEVKFKGHSIADVLDMNVEEAAELFKAVPAIRDKMRMLQEVGLGYIKVGQSATTLSGGEAQRVKLSKELSRRATGKTLYILDEPTTGLHFEDVRKLLEVLHRLVDTGNTVVVIEHNLDVIKTADWVIDLGPGGGVNGGKIIAEGVPETIADVAMSATGQYLRPMLERASVKPKVVETKPVRPKRTRKVEADEPDLIGAK